MVPCTVQIAGILSLGSDARYRSKRVLALTVGTREPRRAQEEKFRKGKLSPEEVRLQDRLSVDYCFITLSPA